VIHIYGVIFGPPQERRAALAISCLGAGMVSSGPDLLGREAHAGPTGHNTHSLSLFDGFWLSSKIGVSMKMRRSL